MTKPHIYRQGSHDQTCGLYACINLLAFLYPHQTKEDSQWVWQHLLAELERRKWLYRVMRVGLNGQELTVLIKHLQKLGYKIPYSKPFHSNSEITLAYFWEAMRCHLKQPEGALILIGCKVHWSLVERVTSRYLFLRDSDGVQRIDKNECGVGKSHRKFYKLLPQHAYFVRAELNHE